MEMTVDQEEEAGEWFRLRNQWEREAMDKAREEAEEEAAKKRKG